MIRVLLALDDRDTRTFYAANLHTAGFRVITSGTREALQVARRTGPQVIVVGVTRASEVRRCADLKRQADLTGVPVIALASLATAGSLEAACDLVLPVESLPDVLVEAIDRVVPKTRS